MPVKIKAVVACMAIDQDGKPDLELHAKVTRGKRNVPNGFDPVDGKPLTKQEEFAHVYVKQDQTHAVHFEMPVEAAAEFPVGKEVTITIE